LHIFVRAEAHDRLAMDSKLTTEVDSETACQQRGAADQTGTEAQFCEELGRQ